MSRLTSRVRRISLSLTVILCLAVTSTPAALALDPVASVTGSAVSSSEPTASVEGTSSAESTTAIPAVETTAHAAPSDEASDSIPALSPQAFALTRVEQSAPEVLISSGWYVADNTDMSGGSYMFSRTLGARVAFEFTGTSVAWVGPRYSSYGQAEVILDGVSQGVIDQFAPGFEPEAVIWSAGGLADTQHRVEIRVLMSKDPASASYSVCVDAFDIEGTPLAPTAFDPITRYEDDDPLIAYGPRWTPSTNASMSDFGYRYAREGGTSAVVRFQGTGIAYIAPRYFSYGEVQVVLDGVDQGIVSLASARPLDRQVVWSRWDLADGEHVLEIHSLGAHEDPALNSYSVFVDAFDIAGTLLDARGDGAIESIEQEDTRLSYSDFWNSAANATMSGGSYRFCKVPDAGFTVEFTGTGISWIGPKYDSYGRAEVVLDGVSQGAVSLYTPEYDPQRAIWSVQGLDQGTHTLTVRTLGTKDAWSRYISVCVDRLEVTGAPEQAVTRIEDDDRRMTFTGGWKALLSPPASGGTARLTRRAGAELLIGFRGTSATLVGPVGTGFGQFEVFVDGVSHGVVSQYASYGASHVALHTISGLSDGEHTLRLVVLGTGVSDATGVAVAIDAVDLLGEASRVTPSTAMETADETDSRLYFSGGWKSAPYAGMSEGGHRYSRFAGSSVTVAFEGTGVSILGSKHPAYGLAAVSLDGADQGTVSAYGAPDRRNQRVLWAIDGLDPGKHTVVLKVAGQPDPESYGQYVSIDGVEVEGTLVAARPRAPFAYSWSRYIVIDKSEFRLYHVIDGYIDAVYPIAHGKPSTPTPSRVWRIDAKYYSDPLGVYGPRKMRLFQRVWTGSSYAYWYTSYLIHGTNEPWVIGTQASAGCIRLDNADVLKLYPRVALGTMVVTRE